MLRCVFRISMPRPFRALTRGDRPISRRTRERNSTFFPRESTSVAMRCGAATATGTPGKPAPVPRSKYRKNPSSGMAHEASAGNDREEAR